MFVEIPSIAVQPIKEPEFDNRGVAVFAARLDLIHPVVSGNKLFKLQPFIAECEITAHRTLLTFGGAYSNHLAATAFFCRQQNMKAIGLVRGEEPRVFSTTLKYCLAEKMELHFLSRTEYPVLSSGKNIEELHNRYGPCSIVPEGGFSPKGAAGAANIMDLLAATKATHICTAVGTATTLAGLLQNNPAQAQIIAVPVIKNMTDIDDRLIQLGCSPEQTPIIFGGYDFGGYAKYNNELIDFINNLYEVHELPTDFVYTAKMFYGVFDQIKKGFFPSGSRVVCLHTGGLQGNSSAPAIRF